MTSQLGWAVDVDTFVQIDSVPWSQASLDEVSPSTGAPENETTLTVRRAFLRVEGHRDGFKAGMELDGNTLAGPAARLLGAHVGWAMPSGAAPSLVDVDLGLMLIPFGTATPTNARYRYFMEQPTFLRALFPGEYDAGVRAKGAYGLARWSVAAMNGAPSRDAQWKGQDPTAGYDLIGRVGMELAAPQLYGRPRFVAGFSGLTGTALHPGTPPTKDTFQWVDENMDGIVQPTELQVVPGMPAIPSQPFHHAAIGADAQVQWCLQWAGAGEAFFEGALSTNLDRAVYFADPIATSRTIRELGFELGVIQHLTENGLVGVRYDRYDADRDASTQLGVDLVGVHRVFETWAFLAAAQYDTVRLSFEYDHVRNPFGLATDGTPTTKADDRAVIRAQAEF